jgi:hypothetical protein
VAWRRVSWPAPGHLDQVLAPVLGVGTAFHQALCLQRVDQGDHRGAVDPEPAGGLLLGQRVLVGQGVEHGQLAPVDAVRDQGGPDQFGELQLGVFQQRVEALVGHPQILPPR